MAPLRVVHVAPPQPLLQSHTRASVHSPRLGPPQSAGHIRVAAITAQRNRNTKENIEHTCIPWLPWYCTVHLLDPRTAHAVLHSTVQDSTIQCSTEQYSGALTWTRGTKDEGHRFDSHNRQVRKDCALSPGAVTCGQVRAPLCTGESSYYTVLYVCSNVIHCAPLCSPGHEARRTKGTGLTPTTAESAKTPSVHVSFTPGLAGGTSSHLYCTGCTAW